MPPGTKRVAKSSMMGTDQIVSWGRTVSKLHKGPTMTDSERREKARLRSERWRRAHGNLGFTLVYVTHKRDEAEALGARIIFLRCGRIDDVASAAR